MLIKIRIHNLDSSIEGFLDNNVLMALSSACSYTIMGAEFSRHYQAGHWDGTKKLFRLKSKTFPTGLLSIVVGILYEAGIPYELIDERKEPQLDELYCKIVPRDYQEEATKETLSKTRGIVKAACGSGKTVLMEDFIAKTGLKTLVITSTSSVFNQTFRRFSEHFEEKIGKIGNGYQILDKRITVGLIQSLVKFPKDLKLAKFLSDVECLLIDEAHHIATKSVVDVSSACLNAYYRVGYSATPFRDDRADIVLQAVAGRKIVDLSASKLIELGYLAKPTIKFMHFRHSRQPAYLNYGKLYQQEIVHNIERNKLICDLALKHMLQDESVLISVTQLAHGHNLEKMLKERYPQDLWEKIRFVNGKTHPEKLDSTLKELNTKDLLCVIATSVYKEGVDSPGINILIDAKAEDSQVSAFQTIGRALRKTETKKDVIVYDLYDEGTRFFAKHAQSREEIYRTEPLFIIEHIV